MASTSAGTSSSGCSTQVQTTTSSSEGGFFTAVAEVPDQKKQKRMLSNRESARRSRQRKQKHLDDLNVQVNQLKTENSQTSISLSETLRLYMNVEADNSILRTQMTELGTRLQSLHDILYGVNGFQLFEEEEYDPAGGIIGGGDWFSTRSWTNEMKMLNQTMMLNQQMML